MPEHAMTYFFTCYSGSFSAQVRGFGKNFIRTVMVADQSWLTNRPHYKTQTPMSYCLNEYNNVTIAIVVYVTTNGHLPNVI